MEQYPKLYLYRRIVQAKLFIDENYGSNIDLSSISDEACFSKSHFIRLFQSIYNKTPHQYLIFVRIENAKELLKNDSAVSAVCYAVGFESISSFTGLFKRLVGISPAVYKKQEAKRKEDIKLDPLKYIPNCFAENKGWTKK